MAFKSVRKSGFGADRNRFAVSSRTLIALGLCLAVSACQGFGDLMGDGSLSPSAKPVTVENVRSGRLARLGAAQHPQILATYGGEYSNARMERAVAGIVGKLVTVSDNPSQVYQVTILDTPVVNAFALPGGYLYVSRGLLALANDSAELAAVIAHEMAHVTANHGVLRQQKEAEAELAGRVVSEVLSDRDAGRRALVRGRLALAQFSRNQELEADAVGIAAMGEAGFDPYAAADFQQTMSAYNTARKSAGANDDSLDFLSTHPSTPQRVSLALGHARKFGARGIGARDRDAYLSGIDGILYGDSPDEGYLRGQIYAHKGLGIRLEFPAGFDIENRPDAILAARQSDGAAVRFDGVDVPARQSLTEYLASGWVEGLDVGSVRAMRVNGLDGAVAKARVDDWSFDVTVIRAGGAVYRILSAVPVGTIDVDTIATPVRNSFRGLTNAEKAALSPLKIKIVQAGRGDTVAKLAARMKGVDRSALFFRVFNGMKAGEELVEGQRYKTVTD